MSAIMLKLCNPGRRMILSVMGIFVFIVVFFQFSAFPSRTYFSTVSSHEDLSFPHFGNLIVDNHTLDLVGGVGNVSHVVSRSDTVDFGKGAMSLVKFRSLENRVDKVYMFDNGTTQEEGHKHLALVESRPRREVLTNFSKEFVQISVDTLGSTSTLPVHGIKQFVRMEAGNVNRNIVMSLKNESLMIERYVRKMRGSTITFSEMESMLLKGFPTSLTPMKGRISVARDRELISARLQIKNAPIVRNLADLHAPLFRNVSVFKRSYELMERTLKIYTYKEGEKPIFHKPKLRGIYAAEGWFMKLLERSKCFSTRDPRKAHMFYLPFSSETLRLNLHRQNPHSMKELEHYLTDYVNLIRKKYRFWNRTGGADHFFVACHDWAPRITRQEDMRNCIRALCNANAARGFSIGKDVSVPVTFVRSGNEPIRDIGGKPSSERHTLAFFAGRTHGYLRPLLLKYWENKAPDMKIFGPMHRDLKGKAIYREFMKSSKYCICARGYGVHTPRVVESIFYECVPVIISDNYVPPFFEVLDWDAFAVFIQEKDIPNLRNILLSIPEDRYRVMQERVKMVQKHFVWQKTLEKYDLFHMILHSIWYNRLSQIKQP